MIGLYKYDSVSSMKNKDNQSWFGIQGTKIQNAQFILEVIIYTYESLPKESDPLSIGISNDCCIRGA